MRVPGPKTTFTLQKPTQTRTTGGGVTNTWADQVTFDASIGPISASETAAYRRETEISQQRVIIGYEEIGDTYASEVKAKNRLYAANSNNELSAETFDIISVQPFRYPGNKIATWELIIQKIE